MVVDLGVVLSLWWVLGIIVAGVVGSYTFTWLAFNGTCDGIGGCWGACDGLVKNDLICVGERLNVLEKG